MRIESVEAIPVEIPLSKVAPIKNGIIEIPEGPGFGLELDEDRRSCKRIPTGGGYRAASLPISSRPRRSNIIALSYR
jgi:hypothetical protein